MENKKNRGVINKKAYEDQWVSLVSSILELSHYSLSLSYSWTLEFSWSTLGECGILGVLEKEGKERAGKHKRTSGSVTTLDLACRYRVSFMCSDLVLACIAYTCGLLVMMYH